MQFKSLALAALLLLPPAATADVKYPDIHTMMTQGRLIVGSTLQLAGQTLQIADNSKPEQGFLLLETLRQVNGRHTYRGFIQQGPDVTLTVLQHNDGSMTKIYQSETGTQIKQVDGVRKEPLHPQISPSTEITNTNPQWHNRVADIRNVTNNAPQLSPPTVDSGINSVDSLVLFDPRLPARVNRVGRQFETDLQGAMNLTQTIFENSELAFSHNLIATHSVSLPSTTQRYINSPTEDILDELVASGEVQRLKDLYDADVVHYIGITDQVCGQAFVASEVDLNNDFNSTSLDFHAAYTNYGCLGNGTFAHELGHNLALYHDRYTLANNEDGAGEAFDNHIPYGYIQPEGDFYTTMAYQSSCTDVFTDAACEPAPIYSNPDVVIDGSAAGALAAEVESAHASRALGLTLPWAVVYSTHQDYTGMSINPDGDGNATLAWSPNENASYVLLDRSCHDSRFFSSAQIAAGTEVSGGAVTGSLLDTTALRACLLESLDASGSGYRAIAEYQANLDQSGSQPAYLLARGNALWIFDSSLEYAIDFWVSDENVANSDIQLALYNDASGGRPTIADGVAQASEWFDVTITGSGLERTATITFKKSLTAIAAELQRDNLHNPFSLPVAIVDRRFTGYNVSSIFWISDDPEQPSKGLPYGFFEDGEFLLNEQPYDIAAVLNNVPENASVTVQQTGDIRLPNFQYNVVAGDTVNQRRVEITGDPVTITSNGRWQMLASWGNAADQRITLSLPGYAEDGQRVKDVQVLSDLVAGEDILIEVTLANLQDNAFWDSLEIRRLVPGEEDIVFDTPQSQDGNVFVFNVGALEAGEYEFQVALDYVDGGQIVYTLNLTVAESGSGNVNQSPTVSVDGPTANLVPDESFTLTAQASDPDGETLSYSWEQTAGSALTLTGANSAELTVTPDVGGSYTVEVTVTDPSGASASASYSFTVEDEPVAPPPVEEPDSGGSSGGSVGWLLILIGLLGSLRSRGRPWRAG